MWDPPPSLWGTYLVELESLNPKKTREKFGMSERRREERLRKKAEAELNAIARPYRTPSKTSLEPEDRALRMQRKWSR